MGPEDWNMRGVDILAILVLTAAAAAPGNAAACGESVFRIGKGVNYRAYSAPIPARVLVYAHSDADREVAWQLRGAGHNVLVVESDAALAVHLDEHPFDVLIAPALKRAAVESGSTALPTRPDWLPVFEDGAGDPEAVRADYGRGLSSDDDVRKYLKAIHKSIREKGR